MATANTLIDGRSRTDDRQQLLGTAGTSGQPHGGQQQHREQWWFRRCPARMAATMAFLELKQPLHLLSPRMWQAVRGERAGPRSNRSTGWGQLTALGIPTGALPSHSLGDVGLRVLGALRDAVRSGGWRHAGRGTVRQVTTFPAPHAAPLSVLSPEHAHPRMRRADTQDREVTGCLCWDPKSACVVRGMSEHRDAATGSCTRTRTRTQQLAAAARPKYLKVHVAHNYTEYAHRLVLWLFDGPPKKDDREATHLCNNRACLNPAHIVWVRHPSLLLLSGSTCACAACSTCYVHHCSNHPGKLLMTCVHCACRPSTNTTCSSAQHACAPRLRLRTTRTHASHARLLNTGSRRTRIALHWCTSLGVRG